MPEMGMVGEHQVDVFVVLPAEHRVLTFDLSRKESHSFVLHRRTVQGDELEMKEVRGFDELRQDQFAVVGGVSRVIGPRPVVVLEKHKPGVLDAVALRRRDGKQHAFGKARVGRELHFVIRLGQHQDFSGRRARFLVASPELFQGETDAGAQFFQRKRVGESAEGLSA